MSLCAEVGGRGAKGLRLWGSRPGSSALTRCLMPILSLPIKRSVASWLMGLGRRGPGSSNSRAGDKTVDCYYCPLSKVSPPTPKQTFQSPLLARSPLPPRERLRESSHMRSAGPEPGGGAGRESSYEGGGAC